ncbi:MAG: TonB family protein [Candidatus Acidiferrales bacterium]
MARIAQRRLMRMSLALLLPLAAAGSARAQQTTMDIAAAQMAAAIEHSNLAPASVAVFDFMGPDKQLNDLGRKLADDFSAALAKSDANLKVEDRSRVADAVSKGALVPAVLLDPVSLSVLAEDLGADVFVMGTVVADGETLRITVESFLRAEDREQIASADYSLPLDDEEKGLLAKKILDDLDPAFPASGTHGYGYPRCLYCPAPSFTQEAIHHHIQGTVEMEAKIGLDGTAQEIRVLKPLPYGLTQAAIETVQSWRFTPAKGPDGNPASVRQLLEVGFHLSEGP